jgi:hypothetical protein
MWRAAVVPGLVILAAVSAQAPAGAAMSQDNPEKRTMATRSKFHCNIKALNPPERAEHKELTDKLIAARKEIVETEKGYEFRFDPSTVSLAELARSAAAEGKCDPFLIFTSTWNVPAVFCACD